MAYYAKNTTNLSFLKMWRYLQRHKVENNIFMLTTLNKDLVDFSWKYYKSLDRDSDEYHEYRTMVLKECEDNIWFYFREIVTEDDIASPQEVFTSHFTLTPKRMLMIYLFERASYITVENNEMDNRTLELLWDYACGTKHNSLFVNRSYSDGHVEECKRMVQRILQATGTVFPIRLNQALANSINGYLTDGYQLLKQQGSILNLNMPDILKIKDRIDQIYQPEIYKIVEHIKKYHVVDHLNRFNLFAVDPALTVYDFSILLLFLQINNKHMNYKAFLYGGIDLNKLTGASQERNTWLNMIAMSSYASYLSGSKYNHHKNQLSIKLNSDDPFITIYDSQTTQDFYIIDEFSSK